MWQEQRSGSSNWPEATQRQLYMFYYKNKTVLPRLLFTFDIRIEYIGWMIFLYGCSYWSQQFLHACRMTIQVHTFFLLLSVPTFCMPNHFNYFSSVDFVISTSAAVCLIFSKVMLISNNFSISTALNTSLFPLLHFDSLIALSQPLLCFHT